MADETIINPQPPVPQQPTPNSTAVLILGICSIVLCLCWGVGIIFSLAALFMANRGKKEYEAHPERYTANSYNNLKAGKVVAIIGLILGSLVVLIMLVGRIFYNEQINEMMEQWQEQQLNR